MLIIRRKNAVKEIILLRQFPVFDVMHFVVRFSSVQRINHAVQEIPGSLTGEQLIHELTGLCNPDDLLLNLFVPLGSFPKAVKP